MIQSSNVQPIYVLTRLGWRCSDQNYYGIGESKEEALAKFIDPKKRKPFINSSAKKQ